MDMFRTLLRNWLPPALVPRIAHLCGTRGKFEGDFITWEAASAQCTGYDADVILSKVLAATLKVKRGEVAFERDSVTFDQMEYTWPLLSGLMWVAARDYGRLNVLDFGGALGSSYFQNQKFLVSLPKVHWNIVEQPHYIEAGQTHIQNDQLRFYRSIEECLLENKPNVILLSSVLQYLKSPIGLLKILSAINAKSLIIDRTPFTALSKNKLLIQNVPARIYPASYPMWVFSRQLFMKNLNANWLEVADELSPEGNIESNCGLKFSFQYMLYESRL